MIKNFKDKYIKNLFLYYLYRYFKYRSKFFKSYGATGEDVLINKIFNEKKGFYIDVGALHPINGSLTYNLYRKGWKGLNLDIVDNNIKLFKIFRKRDASLKIAVSKEKGFIKSYIFNSGSGLNTLEKKWADKWSRSLNINYRVEKIKKNSLNNLIKEYKIPKSVELLNIDVEGHELDVLKGTNLKIFRPKIIAIEIHVKKTEDIFKTKVYGVLKKYNYDLISQYYHTSFFKASEFKIDTI